MEKCSFCIQRIRRAGRIAAKEDREMHDGEITPACVQACPTNALNFGDLNDKNSKVRSMAGDKRGYRVLESLGTEPSVIYLKKVDKSAHSEEDRH
jgi:molybdopterin-containing oxidoreductase family iron-sulfur binding subunit